MRQGLSSELDEELSVASRWRLINRLRLKRFEYVNSHGRSVVVSELGIVKHCMLTLMTRSGGAKNSGRSNAGCCLKVEALAEEMNVSLASATRALAACKGRGLIESEPNYAGPTWHRINWKTVQEIVEATSDRGSEDSEDASLGGVSGTDDASLGGTSLGGTSDRGTSLGKQATSLGSEGTSLGALEADPSTVSSRARGLNINKYKVEHQDKAEEFAFDGSSSVGTGDAAFLTGYSPEFEEWWGVYPKRIKKRPASGEYQAVVAYLVGSRGITDQQAQEWLLTVTKDYASSPAGQSSEFLPGPDTWLREHRFEDDRSEWQRSSNSEKAVGKPKAFPLTAKKPRGVM